MAVYNRYADIIEIIVRDLTGRKMEHLKVDSANKPAQKKIGTKLYTKYDVDLTPDKSQDLKEEKSWIDSDNSFI